MAVVESLVGLGDRVEFALRLAQVIAWCEPRGSIDDPACSLRSQELRPRVLEENRESIVRMVHSSRAYRREVRDAQPVARADDLKGGRLLIYYPDEDLADGAAEAETRGFFDGDDAPPWDTWVALFRDAETSQWADYLVSWVPAAFVELVQRGIDVAMVECIGWLDETNVAVASHLRANGILEPA